MTLENEMLRIGRVIAADHGLTVDVQGLSAYATKGRVVIPSIRTFDWLGPNAERMLHGLLDHEIGHARFTDFDTMPKARREGGEALAATVNAVEDGYIEREMSRLYIGCAQNLDRKNRWFWTGEKWQASFATQDRWSAFVQALTLVLRGTIKSTDVKPVRRDVFVMLEEVKHLVAKARNASSSHECYQVAHEIWQHFRQPPSERGGSDDDDDSDDTSDGQDDSETTQAPGVPDEEQEEEGSSDDAGEEAGDEAEGAGDDDSAETSEETEDGEEGEQGSDFQLEGDWRPGTDPITPEAAFNIEIQYDAENESYRIFSEDPKFAVETVLEVQEYERAQALMVIDSVREHSYAVTQAFEVALRARREKRRVGGYDEGHLDIEMLGEFMVGASSADTIYLQEVADDDRDVAVAILLDCSGSMGGSDKITVARDTAFALSLALDSVQVAHEICGFTTAMSNHGFDKTNTREITEARNRLTAALVESEAHGVSPLLFARELHGAPRVASMWRQYPTQVPNHVIFKSFDAPDASGLMRAKALQENLDGEAVLWQARRLARRPEKRRVMFVLSDGWPAGHRSHVKGAEFLKDTVRHVVDAGIEIYGIGICSDAVAQFYPRYWMVDSVARLQEVALTAMVDVLTEGRQEARCVAL